jgi:hypothetical protein
MNPSHRALQDRPARFIPSVDRVPVGRMRVSVFDETCINRLAGDLEAASVRVASTWGREHTGL